MLQKVRGFTLYELLMTLVLIGVLAGLSIPSFSKIVARNRMSTEINAPQPDEHGNQCPLSCHPCGSQRVDHAATGCLDLPEPRRRKLQARKGLVGGMDYVQ
jgi:prepilin-type N-terminal cleavage/methylation domain-containing protein